MKKIYILIWFLCNYSCFYAMNNGVALDRGVVNQNILSLQEMAMTQVLVNIEKSSDEELNEIIEGKSKYNRASNYDDLMRSVMAKKPIGEQYVSHKVNGWEPGFKRVTFDSMSKQCVFSHYEAHRQGLFVCDFNEGKIVTRNDAAFYYDSIKYSPSGNVMMCRRWNGKYDLLSHDLKIMKTDVAGKKRRVLDFCISDDKFVFEHDKNGKRIESVIDAQGNVLMEADLFQFSSDGRVMLKKEGEKYIVCKDGDIKTIYLDVRYGQLSKSGKQLFLQYTNGECTVIDFCSKSEQKLHFLYGWHSNVRFSTNGLYVILHDIANSRDVVIDINAGLASYLPFEAATNLVFDDEYICIFPRNSYGFSVKIADLFREDNQGKSFIWCIQNNLAKKFNYGSACLSKTGKKIVFVGDEDKQCSFKELMGDGINQELTFSNVTKAHLSPCGSILILFKEDKTCEIVRPCNNFSSYALKCLLEKK
jgi:hypothetical protein